MESGKGKVYLAGMQTEGMSIKLLFAFQGKSPLASGARGSFRERAFCYGTETVTPFLPAPQLRFSMT